MYERSKAAAGPRRIAAAAAALVILLLFLCVVARRDPVLAGSYVPRVATGIRYMAGQKTLVKFRGRKSFPDMSGEAIVDRTASTTTIEMSVTNMPSPLQLGPGHVTYVLWQIASDGSPTALGELKPSSTGQFDADVKADSYAGSFALLVTAEPHFMVDRPSLSVMLENVAPTDAVSFSIDYLARSDTYFRDPKTPQVSPADYAKTPLIIVEARQAVALAQHAGAARHARAMLDAARSYVRDSEEAWRTGKDAATIEVLAIQAIGNASIAEQQAQIYRQSNVNITAGNGSVNSMNRAFANMSNGAFANALNLSILNANTNSTHSIGETLAGHSLVGNATGNIAFSNSNGASNSLSTSAAELLSRKTDLETHVAAIKMALQKAQEEAGAEEALMSEYVKEIERINTSQSGKVGHLSESSLRQERVASLQSQQAEAKVQADLKKEHIAALLRDFAEAQDELKLLTAELSPGPNTQTGTDDDPSTIRISRYPSVEAKDEVAPGEKFSVQVSLTDELLTPNVIVKSVDSAVEKEESGRVSITLPDSPETKEWDIDVILAVSGSDLTIEGADTATIKLPRAGDSTPARFTLSAKAMTDANRKTRVSAAFFNKKTNGFLLKVEREITIKQAAAAESKSGAPGVAPERRALARSEIAPAPVVTQPAATRSQPATFPNTQFNLETNVSADMTVIVETQRKTEAGSDLLISINSPYYHGAGSYTLPADMAKFVESEFTVFSRGRPRGADLMMGSGILSGKATPERMKAFGEKLYDRFVPDKFKEAFWQTRQKMGSKFKTILIITDDPEFPWELMRPRPDKDSPSIDFLGLEYAVGRLHDPNGKVLGNTQPQNAFISGLDVVPPTYHGATALPTVKEEVDFLRSLTVFNNMDGVRQMDGNSDELKTLLGAMPPHIIHFAGHGSEKKDANDMTSSSVRLGDQDLGYSEWSAMMTRGGPNRPFFFLNACDVGRSGKFLTFTDGFGPAVLESGASGFIGALWSIQDDSAARFAEKFYGQMQQDLNKNGFVSVADLTRRIKAEYLQDPDPTFLAYVYYGDPNLRLVSRKPPTTATLIKTISGGVLNGKALVLPQPEYSKEARDAGAAGPVTVEVVVDERGDVISAKAASGAEILRPMAEAAALKAKFDGVTLSGVPFRVSGVITYLFAP